MASAERTVAARSKDGVNAHDMPGGWRVVVARLGERYQAWYHHTNDDPRIIASVMNAAERWLERETANIS